MNPETRAQMADGMIAILAQQTEKQMREQGIDVSAWTLATITMVGHLLRRDPETMMAVFDLSHGMNLPETKTQWDEWSDHALRIIRICMYESDSPEDAAERVRQIGG